MPMEQFSRIIEPSAGAGAFLRELPKSSIGYDIFPECEGIIKGDYLEQEIEYKKNSLVIGNPPFGNGDLPVKFLKKSFEHSDYVAFIIPGNNYKKKSSISGIKLYKSYMLPKLKYSGVELSCCLNIYVKGDEFVKKIKDVEIIEFSRAKNTTSEEEKKYLDTKSDYRIVCFGGIRILEENFKETRVEELKITFKNKINFKPILELFLKEKSKKCISSGRVTKPEIISLIYDNVPEVRAN